MPQDQAIEQFISSRPQCWLAYSRVKASLAKEKPPLSVSAVSHYIKNQKEILFCGNLTKINKM